MMPIGKGWKRVGSLAVALLILAAAIQAGLDRTTAGSGERSGNFTSATSLARFMGGIRQYFAYTFFIKTDKLYHVYGNDAELIPYFRIITFLDPHYIDAYYILPGLLYDVGRREEAIEICREGIRANPESGDLYFGLGDLMLKEDQYEEALGAFEQAYALNRRIVDKYIITRGLEVLYKKLGREEDARRISSEAIITNRVHLVDEELEVEDQLQLVRRINLDCDLIVPVGLE